MPESRIAFPTSSSLLNGRTQHTNGYMSCNFYFLLVQRGSVYESVAFLQSPGHLLRTNLVGPQAKHRDGFPITQSFYRHRTVHHGSNGGPTSLHCDSHAAANCRPRPPLSYAHHAMPEIENALCRGPEGRGGGNAESRKQYLFVHVRGTDVGLQLVVACL